VAAFRAFQLEAAAEIGFGAGVAEIFAGRSFMIQGNLEARRSPAGALLGYSSAIMLARTPRVLRRRLRPRFETLQCPALDERIARIGEELLEARPRIVAGIPEYVAGILQTLLSGPRAPAIAEALRGVALYGWSGSPIGPYRSFFEGVFTPGCSFLDAVSATEGALGILCARTGGYRFAFDRSLLLFLAEGGERRFAWELEPGQEAEVILGSHAGLLGYRTGDRIRLLSRDPLRFELLARTRALAPGGLEGEVSSLLARTSVDYYLYLDPAESRLEAALEAGAASVEPAVRALAARAGCREVSVRLLPRGRICRAGLRASAAGVAKLPRFNRDPRVHELIARHL
jgi:hypothetical protein